MAGMFVFARTAQGGLGLGLVVLYCIFAGDVYLKCLNWRPVILFINAIKERFSHDSDVMFLQ